MSPFEKLPISSSSSIEIISNWLMANALPPSIQLEAENFAKVMGQSPAPTNAPKRLVVLTALDSHDSRTITKVKDIAHTWHREHSHSPIQIMFTWMDKEKWADWLKSVYGVKKQDHPVVVIVDHGVCLQRRLSSALINVIHSVSYTTIQWPMAHPFLLTWRTSIWHLKVSKAVSFERSILRT